MSLIDDFGDGFTIPTKEPDDTGKVIQFPGQKNRIQTNYESRRGRPLWFAEKPVGPFDEPEILGN